MMGDVVSSDSMDSSHAYDKECHFVHWFLRRVFNQIRDHGHLHSLQPIGGVVK